jgi:hypothetical protein
MAQEVAQNQPSSARSHAQKGFKHIKGLNLRVKPNLLGNISNIHRAYGDGITLFEYDSLPLFHKKTFSK